MDLNAEPFIIIVNKTYIYNMLFARNDQYHNYNTRQSRSLYPSVGRGEAIYNNTGRSHFTE